MEAVGELSVELSTRLSGRRSRMSRWETTERSPAPGGGTEEEEKTRELEQILPLRLLEQSNSLILIWTIYMYPSYVKYIICIIFI